MGFLILTAKREDPLSKSPYCSMEHPTALDVHAHKSTTVTTDPAVLVLASVPSGNCAVFAIIEAHRFLVVIFACLGHGLILLPVLSLLGPAAYTYV